MKDLDGLDPEDPESDRLSKLIEEVRHHIEEEETEARRCCARRQWLPRGRILPHPTNRP